MKSAQFEVDVNYEDVLAFSKMSGDWNSLHTDYEYSRGTILNSPIAHGKYYAGLISRIRVAKHTVDKILCVDYQDYCYLERGLDERQYSAPGVDIPVVSVMKSNYAAYPEYHKLLDNLELISPNGLYGGYLANKYCIGVIEANKRYRAVNLCEPFLSPRGIRHPLIDGKTLSNTSKTISDICLILIWRLICLK